MSSEVVELCCKLIAQASVNPQEKEYRQTPYGEERMADFVYGWLAGQGLKPQRQRVLAGRENVFAMAEGADRSRTLLLAGHLDTVDVTGMTVEPFEPKIAEGRIYGRGACDDKGPLAALMAAFRDRVRKGGLPWNLVLLATCGEEYDMAGASFFAEHFPGEITAAVFAEPTDLEVIVAHKGVLRLTMRTRGRSVHSSVPERGENAIYTMARAVTRVEQFAADLSRRPGHPALQQETLAVTVVEGGRQINVIPDSCQGRIDWRFLPGRTPRQCREELAEFLNRQMPGQVELELMNEYQPMETNPDHPVVAALLAAAQETAGIRRTASVAYATDASAFHGRSIPTPIFGPGSIHQAHTADEYIEIDQLEKGLAAYRVFLERGWE